jgi:hypothetical protein
MFSRVILIIFTFLFTFSAFSQTTTPKLRMNAEIGFLGVVDHRIQFSNSGTYIDYVSQGAQDVLFPVTRFSLDFNLTSRSSITLLYQPLKLETSNVLEEDIIVDDLVFPAGKGVDFLFNFGFYRGSYLYEFMPNNSKYDFAFGATIQIRNATINFEAQDGTGFRGSRDIGIVPALKLRTKRYFGNNYFIGLEADGIYAPVSYLNGADNEIVGAILDASLNGGFRLRKEAFTFLNLRYIGGGAVGTDPDFTGPGDGYVRNWLHFVNVSIGFSYEFY